MFLKDHQKSPGIPKTFDVEINWAVCGAKDRWLLQGKASAQSRSGSLLWLMDLVSRMRFKKLWIRKAGIGVWVMRLPLFSRTHSSEISLFPFPFFFQDVCIGLIMVQIRHNDLKAGDASCHSLFCTGIIFYFSCASFIHPSVHFSCSIRGPLAHFIG